MILPFPSRPEDWLRIWKTTKTITLLSDQQEVTSIPIVSAEAFIVDSLERLSVVKIAVLGGAFNVCFLPDCEAVKGTLTYFIANNDPKSGHWKIPKKFIPQSTLCKRDD